MSNFLSGDAAWAFRACAAGGVSGFPRKFRSGRLIGQLAGCFQFFAIAATLQAQNPIPVQTFYLPVPEGQLLQTLRSIEGGTTWIGSSQKPSNPIHYYVSISSVADGTVIYYDKMEDGYESTIHNPTSIYDPATNPSGTQIWGDGDPANGFPPGIPNDIINAGTVIILNNPIDTTVAPNPANPLFRAGDKISATKAIAVTVAGWASGSDTLLAGANEVFDTVSWGTDYRIPVGENIPDSEDAQMFEYSGAAIMAGEGGSVVEIDADGDGVFESTVNLVEGQSHHINGGLNVGGRFLSDRPVQVDLMTGDRQDGYETRFYRLLPVQLWTNSYYTPVSTPSSAQDTAGTSTAVWLYNPGVSPISVTYRHRNSTGLISNVSNKTTPYASVPLPGSAPGNVYGPIVELNSNGTLPGPSPEGAWIGIVNRSSGNNPTIESKVANAQAAGAAAVIIVRNNGGTTYPTETAGSPVIPVVGMTQNGGAALRAAGLGAGWVRVSGNTASGTISVPAGGYARQVLVDGYGARFFTAGGENFYAISTTDSGGTTLSNNTAGSNRTWDWGFTLVPESSLTPQVLIGLGIGRDPTSATNPNENGNPVWVTTTGNGDTNATVYVDYDSDPTTGPFTDPNGNKYDLALTLREFEMAKVYNPSGDQTGMLLYTLNPGVKLAAAWGQDVLQASAGAPGLDSGTGIPPLPQFLGTKKSVLFIDQDDDGYVSPGDTLEYTIIITNISRVPVSDLNLEDVLPDALEYISGSTTFRNSASVITTIPDNGSGTPFPLDEGGIIVPEASLPPNGGTWEISYRTLIRPAQDLQPGEFHIINSATIGGIAVSDPIVLSEIQRIHGRIGDRVWNDLDGNGIQDAGEPGIPGITVRLLDADGNLLNTAMTDGGGWYRFTGMLPGDYRVEFDEPIGFNFSPVNADGQGLSGANNSDADPVTGRTALFTLTTGQHRLTLDAGLVAVVGPLSIVKVSDAGEYVSPGDSIEYTVVVENSGITAQENVTVTDVLPPSLSYVADSISAVIDPPLDPGGTYTVDYTSNDAFVVPYGVTSVTVEAWGAGGGGGKSNTANSNAGGGGGGGGYARGVLSVTPGGSLTVNVGTGGTAGNPGGDSWFGSPSTVRGSGGSGGGSPSSTSGGSGGSSNIGNEATFHGGGGGTGHSDGGNNSRRGGGGGGSATSTTNGGTGANGDSNDGGGGGTGQGNGGNGTQGSNNGNPGNAPGGGGGGGGQNGLGGGGGNGLVRVTYTVPTGIPGSVGAPPALASGWTIPGGGTLTLTFQATVNSPVPGTQIVNTATVTSSETPDEISSTVFDTLTPGAISGSVLADTNGDGNGDTGIEGVTLALLDGNGNLVLDGNGDPITTVTGENGNYSFPNLPPGFYQVAETQPPGYLSVSDADGQNPDLIGDVALIQVVSAGTNTGNDFIEVQPGSISGTVSADTTGDGFGDTGLENVILALLDGGGNPILDGNGDPVTTVTDENGNYSFPNLPPGAYQVVETQPSGYASVSDVDGGNPDHIGDETPINVAPGQSVTGRDFLEVQPGSISGTVLVDTTGDGNGDTPQLGVTIALLDENGDPVPGENDEPITTVTDENGFYIFPNLLPGSYQVTQTVPSGYTAIDDVDDGDFTVIGNEIPITVAPGQSVTGRDFVNTQPGSISGSVLADTDGDDIGDTGLEGVPLTLLDGGGNPILDGNGNPITTVTDENGFYTFPDLLPGTYQVVETQPSGYASVSDIDGGNPDHIGDEIPITITPGQHITGQDFIEVQLGSISGTVLADLDDNGTGDIGLEGVILTLLDGDGNPILDGNGDPITAITDENGNYTFPNLLPGAYQIAETQPSGYGSVSDVDGGDLDLIGNEIPLTVAPGQHVIGRDFVEVELGSISGFVFVNTDPLAGVTLTLLDEFGNPVLDENEEFITTVTGPDGSYSFTGVRPGIYQVGQTQPFGYESDADADGGDLDIIGDVSPIVITPGHHSGNNNFIERIDTCPDEWAEWKHQHPGEEADGNPDLDAHDNLAEFAFALGATNGAGDPFCISPSEEFPGTLQGVFRRPKGATDNVTYTLEYTDELSGSTVWQSIAITPDIIVVTGNGDCTETVTIPGLETLTGLIDGKGFVRIRADLDEENDDEIDHTSWTGVEGWTETPFGICCQTYNNPYLRCATFTGTVETGGVNGQTLSFDTSAGDVDLDTLFTPGVSYYLEVTSGENEGHRFDVVSANGSEITLATDDSLCSKDAPFNTLTGSLAASLEGDGVVIRRHWTLDELFPPTGFVATNSQSTADQVQAFAGGQWIIYWLYDDNGTPRWVDAADSGMADQGATVIPPGQGLFFNNRHSPVSLLAYGEVRENDFIRPLCPGSNLVGGGYPVDQSANTASGREMNLDAGFFGSRDFKTADSFFIWKGDATPGLSTYDTYWLLDGAPVSPSLRRWVKAGDASAAARDHEILLPGNRAAFTSSASGLPDYGYSSPWNP